MNSILALDLAGLTGWALSHNGEIVSGVWDIMPKAEQKIGWRYIKLEKCLQRVANIAGGELVGISYEKAHHRGHEATEYAIGCITRVQAFCAVRNIAHQGFHSATIKKSATGSGHASKEQVIAAIRRKGFKPQDDNEADALALLLFILARTGKRK